MPSSLKPWLINIDVRQLHQDSIVDWPTVTHTGKQYIVESWLAKKRPRRSWISLHGSFIVEVARDSKLGDVVWCCKHCNKVFATRASSSSALHLQ